MQSKPKQRKIIWSRASRQDLTRLYNFLKPKSIEAAQRATLKIKKSPSILRDQPQIAQRVTEFNPREIRKLIVADTRSNQYCVYYEILPKNNINILRVFHAKEDQADISL